MIEFAAETYSQVLIEEMMPLWVKHHHEIQQIPGVELKPNFMMYQSLALANVLRIYTARNGKNLAGYQVFTVINHPHFKDKVQAVMDILYLSPESRLGWMGSMFIKFVDTELRKEGVHLTFRAISARKDFGPVLERQGYELTDLMFMKVL